MGCGGLLGTTIISCLLLIVNATLIVGIGQVLQAIGPTWMRSDRALQFVYYVGPLVMLVTQWWIFDRASDLLERLSRKAEGQKM